jgi:galactokinase
MSDRTARDERAAALGRSAFGDAWRPNVAARANGRIEVIGNHVDYNGGPVVAAAIDRGLTLLAGDSPSGSIRATFPDVGGDRIVTIETGQLGDWRADSAGDPADYLRGVVAAATALGVSVRPSLDIVVHGDLPVAGALSSSAALCVGLALTLLDRELPKAALVRLAQDAEHRMGSPVGTMDQSASVFGGMILFDGAPEQVTPMSVELTGHRFVVLGSGVQHSNARSSYGERVEECRRALELLRISLGRDIDALASVTFDELETASKAGAFEDAPTLYLRARHIVTEVDRVRAALAALERDDWSEFGELMNRSGRSSATDYAISHPVVERLVAEAKTVEGVLGARMMGGGEGGNALALVEEAVIPTLQTLLAESFYRPSGLDPETMMFVCKIGEAASVTDLVRE